MTLNITGKSVPFKINPSAQTVCQVTVRNTTTIPGQHELQIPVYTDNHMQPRHALIFEPLSSFTEKHGLLVAQSVAQNNGGQAVLRILNPLNSPITIHIHEKIVHFKSLQEGDVINSLFEHHKSR